MMGEEFYLKKCRGDKMAFRKVHKTNGHTVYGHDPVRYHRSGYRAQSLDLTNPNAHWEPPTP